MDVVLPEQGVQTKDAAPVLRRAEQAVRAALPVQRVAAAERPDVRQERGPRPSSADRRSPRRRRKSL